MCSLVRVRIRVKIRAVKAKYVGLWGLGLVGTVRHVGQDWRMVRQVNLRGVGVKYVDQKCWRSRVQYVDQDWRRTSQHVSRRWLIFHINMFYCFDSVSCGGVPSEWNIFTQCLMTFRAQGTKHDDMPSNAFLIFC